MIGKSYYFKILPLYLGVKNFFMYTLNRHNFYGVDLSKYLGQLRVHPSVAIMYAVHYIQASPDIPGTSWFTTDPSELCTPTEQFPRCFSAL